MSRKILLIALCGVCLFVTVGCNNNQVEQKNEVASALESDGYTLFEDQIDSKQFDDIAYTITNDSSNTVLAIKNDGSMFQYSLNKKFSNDSYILKYNSKFEGDVLVGFFSSSEADKAYWLFDKEKKLYKFDATTDNISVENDLDIYAIFRGNEFDDSLRKVAFDDFFRRDDYNMYLLKDNNLYTFSWVQIYEFNENPYVDTNKCNINIDLTKEKIEYMDNDFLKTDKNYYLYQYVESEYADQENTNQYVKLQISEYKDEIKYINSSIAVLQNGQVYKR